MKPGMRIALLHAPPELPDFADGVEVQRGLRRSDSVDMVVGFVTERAHLAANIGWILETLAPGGAFWVAWPKRSSGVATDMTDHAVREVALPLGVVDNKVCSVNPVWTALKLVRRRGG